MGQKIKGKIKIAGVRYYKDGWGIASAIPIKMEQGQPKLNAYNTITIKGEMIDPKTGQEYQIVAEEIDDPKWGTQYDLAVFSASLDVSGSDASSKRKYLEFLFTSNQVKALYTALKDPFEVLKNHDVEQLVKVKGCGLRNAGMWMKRFDEQMGLSRLYAELDEYELTPNMMKKLMNFYHSPDAIIQKVKENPYVLTEVGGIGFKTADDIAMKNGMEQWDERRIGAFILYTLDRHGSQGDSYITSDLLMDELIEQFGVDIPDLAIASAIHGEIKDKLWWPDDKTAIGLTKYRDLEQKICDELLRISKAPIMLHCDDIDEKLEQIERKQGWNFTDQQRLAIKTANDNNLTVVNGLAGCVDCDTEFFTGHGWKRIADYKIGDKVLQYNENGTAELVEPIKYIKQSSEALYHFETKYGLSQTLSLNHNVAYVTSKGHLKKVPMHEIIRRNEACTNGFSGEFLTSFSYSGKGLRLFDNEIRLMVAIFADGSFEDYCRTNGRKSYRKVRFNLKKDRKKERLEHLLNKLQISFVKKESAEEGAHVYMFYAPYIGKHFIKDWYDCNRHQLEIIADEVMKWDGEYNTNNRYSTTNKNDADFVQFVFSSLGYRASISIQNRVGSSRTTNGKKYIRKTIEYTVRYTKRNTVGMTASKGKKVNISKVIPKDGYEYCFTVPSGLLVLRKDNKIFITGNCGKTTIANAINKIYCDARSAACCLSGKAAARLGEVIGTTGSTIHRLLEFNPATKEFTHNADSPLSQDLIIIDEISMIGGRLFYYLLRAISGGTKVIMLGDTGQLEAIGECNVAKDIIDSGQIATVTLDKIHRQAEKSAIITESIKVRSGRQIIAEGYSGVQELGENKDMILDCFSDKSNTAHKTLEYFKQELKAVNNDILKVQMICPMRSRGEASVWNLNLLAQDIYNPNKGQGFVEIYYKGRGTAQLREGDKVINVQNNYSDCYMADNDSEEAQVISVPIFNGYIGIVNEIGDEYMVIDFLNVGKVIVPKGLYSNIELAYAITVHKFQGAQTETVIVAIDYGAYALLSRELVYTAVTRAQNKCILVTQNSALRFAVSTEKTSAKKTHLKRLLIEANSPQKDSFIF